MPTLLDPIWRNYVEIWLLVGCEFCLTFSLNMSCFRIFYMLHVTLQSAGAQCFSFFNFLFRTCNFIDCKKNTLLHARGTIKCRVPFLDVACDCSACGHGCAVKWSSLILLLCFQTTLYKRIIIHWFSCAHENTSVNTLQVYMFTLHPNRTIMYTYTSCLE
jgi:hypothetical protein